MNTMNKKMYLIPETEILSLESVRSLMSSPQGGGPGGTGSGDANVSSEDSGDAGFSAPGRKVF